MSDIELPLLLLTSGSGAELSGDLQADLATVTAQISKTQEYLDKYLPVAINFGLRLLLAVVVFLVGSKAIGVFRKIFRRSMEKAGADVGLMQFLDSLVKVLLYFVLIMLLASGFGVDTTSVMALAGSAGLTIGLAFQGSLSNFAGGVLILLLKPFKVGDYIVYTGGNLEGTVAEIEMFYTTLLTADNRKVVIPNGTLSNNSLINVTAQEKRRLDISVNVAYSADLKAAKETCEELLRGEEKVLQGEDNFVVVDELGESAVVLKVCCWVRPGDYLAVRWALTERIKLTFDEKGIEIPFNQLDVNLKS